MIEIYVPSEPRILHANLNASMIRNSESVAYINMKDHKH